MKLIPFLFLVIFTISLYAQDNTSKNPVVELPDFVITGKDIIALKKVDKIKPGFISTISDEFLRPGYSPEELQIKDLSSPVKNDINALTPGNFYKGNIYGGVGIYTTPVIDITYAQPFENVILEGMINVLYNRDYVDNSDMYKSRAAFNFLYWSDINSNFLPGTQFNLHGDYGTHQFKFFASDDPVEERNINSGDFGLELKNDFNKNFIFRFNGLNKVTKISSDNFTENNLNLRGETRFTVSAINIGISADYEKHFVKNNYSSDFGKDFFLFRPLGGFQFTELIKAQFGFTFSRGAGKSLNSIYASTAIKIDKSLTLFGEYAPSPVFESPGELLRKNQYFVVDSASSIFWKKSNAFNASLKYEFSRYFQIDGGFNYFNSDEFPYYSNSVDSGKFTISYADMSSLNPYINFLFYLGPYGEFYSSLNYFDIKDKDNKQIPYNSKFKIYASYNYHFDIGLSTGINATYFSKRYADIANSVSIGDYIDLGLSLKYSFQKNLDLRLDLQNLFNNKNYFWNGYQEIPLNLILGIDYRL